MKTGVLALAAILLALASQAAAPALGGGVEGRALVYNPAPQPVKLVVEPGGVYIAPARGSVYVPAPSRACVAQDSLVVYTGPGERLVLAGWLRGGLLHAGGCVDLENGGSYQLYYELEYLVTVESKPPGVYYQATWAPAGSTVKVSVPSVVERGGFRYEFTGWEAPTPLPPSPNASLPVTSPAVARAVYRVLVAVYLNGSGPLWVGEGTSLARVARLAGWPRVEPGGPGARLVLEGYRVNGSLVPLDKAGEYPLNAPASVSPEYRREYLVRVETPLESRREWVAEGSQLRLAAAASVQVNDTAKLVFDHWLLPNGTTVRRPTVTVNVTGPGVYRAVYEWAYRIRVLSPLGSDTLWARRGEIVPIVQPERLPGVVYDRVLEYYLVNGRKVEPGKAGILLVTVKGPVRVVAVYGVEANMLHLAVLAGFLLAVAAAYLAYQAYHASRAERGEEPPPVGTTY